MLYEVITRWVRDQDLDPGEWALLEEVALLTSKPYLFVANLSEEEYQGGAAYQALLALGEQRQVPVVPILGDLEAELTDFSPEEQREFLQSLRNNFV